MERAPRILIVMAERWPRALMRAALREAGYDAIGVEDIEQALTHRPRDPERGPVRLVIIDHDQATDATAVRRLRGQFGEPDLVLTAHATRAQPPGPWRKVIVRPVSVDDVVAEVRGLLPLPEGTPPLGDGE